MARFSEILVSLIEKRSLIYDLNNKYHSNSVTVQDRLLEEISKEMNVNGW